MSDAPEDGVADEFGQVHGQPGLFVIDASLFPTSVGANPSATVAAIAERAVERFIREHTGDADWTAPKKAAAAEWVLQHKLHNSVDGPSMDPIDIPRPRSALPIAGPRELVFNERMRGFLSSCEADALPQTTKEYLRAEKRGRRAGPQSALTAEFAVEGDLDQFMDKPGHPLGLSGSILWANKRYDVVPEESQLQIFPSGHSDAHQDPCRLGIFLDDKGLVVRTLRYRVVFEGHGERWRLCGEKEVKDDPGVDAVYDLSTLFSQVTREGSGEVFAGALHVRLSDFVNTQLPSFDVRREGVELGLDARLEALLAFGRLTYGNVMAVYGDAITRAVRGVLR